jgi:hypothetical protein
MFINATKSRNKYHNVVDLIGWGRCALHEDTLQKEHVSNDSSPM